MRREVVYSFLEKNRNMLFPNSLYTEEELESMLINAPESLSRYIDSLSLKSPVITFCLGFVLGLDRFYLGDYVWAVIKMITYGGAGIWTVIDLFTAKKRCCDINCRKLVEKINEVSNENAGIGYNQSFTNQPLNYQFPNGQNYMNTYDNNAGIVLMSDEELFGFEPQNQQ